MQDPQVDLSARVENVKRRARPWRSIVALILASILTHGLTIDGMASWLATTVVVWLVTTIGAITLAELLICDGAGST